MASYQIPQFLDSGDKILGPLNLRQFGYVLGGFFICVFIYTSILAIAPSTGAFSVIPAIPVGLFFLYLAMGKFNGRDAEVYIFKFFINLLKKKKLFYIRSPYYNDLDEKLAGLKVSKIERKIAKEVLELQQKSADKYSDFREQTGTDKASKIRQLGRGVDMGWTNTLAEIENRRLRKQSKESILEQTKR